MREHIVASGDCLASIARSYGFFWQTLWDLPENADLRELRREPAILLPGDVVQIPEAELKVIGRPTDSTHLFRYTGEPAVLQLRLLQPEHSEEPERAVEQAPSPDDEQLEVYYDDPVATPSRPDRPWKNAAFNITVGGITTHGRTDGDGKLQVRIPPKAQEALVIVEQGTDREQRLSVKLGHLDPVTTRTGAADRLNNLGYGDGSRPQEPTQEFTQAVIHFQRDQSLEVTGELDTQTQDRLSELHGS